MLRTVTAVITGVIAWALIVTLLNLGLRLAIPGYHAAEATLQFTTAMKIGRLTEAALTSIVAGAIVARMVPLKSWLCWVVGLIILGLFLPVHLGIWTRLPLWYHLAFLVPLVPLVALGGAIGRSAANEQARAS